jgi:hypothetical protein
MGLYSPKGSPPFGVPQVRSRGMDVGDGGNASPDFGARIGEDVRHAMYAEHASDNASSCKGLLSCSAAYYKP